MNNELNYFYITTPIYYVNDKPHIGHAYTTILADVLARYHRLLGTRTFFLTGTDEHGQKVAEAAARNEISPLEQCEATVVRFQDLWKKLAITNDDFIRTTEERHQKIVQSVLQDLFDRGEIYKADYEGSYCVPCERFYTDKDLADGNCPECGREVQAIVEPNYFFKMGAYQDWLIDYINEHPEFIQPVHRRNETLGFLRKPLGDLCISRPKARLSWGIPLPFDKDFVCYVWFDALINYISAIGYAADNDRFNSLWPATYHLIGKDILTTHTVYWPTMLKAIGLELPRTIFAHGWWLVGRDKMGKSLGNVVDPMVMCDQYGIDPFRYFLLAEMTPGNDASFTEEAFVDRYNTDLADNLGNMLNRVVKMIIRHFDGRIPQPNAEAEDDATLRSTILTTVESMETAFDQMKLDRGLEAVIGAVRHCNQYFERTAPWKLAKNGDNDRLATVLYSAAESLRILSALLYPVMPVKMAEMRSVLGVSADLITPTPSELTQWGLLPIGNQMGDIQSLFPRIQKTAENDAGTAGQGAAPASGKNKTKEKTEPKAVEETTMITIDKFAETELLTAKVLSAENVPKTTRLLRLEIEVGDEQRQVVAGIAESYPPESLVGKTVIIVANLEPATIRGVTSHGMLLAAKGDDGYKVITVDGDCNSGVRVG